MIQKWKEPQKRSRINEKESEDGVWKVKELQRGKKMPPVMECSNGREC